MPFNKANEFIITLLGRQEEILKEENEKKIEDKKLEHLMKIFLTKTLLSILIYGLIESLLFTGVSFYGHLGGALFGMLFIFFTGKNKYLLVN